MENICKNCKHFNFKVTGKNGSFGECLNPKNEKSCYVSLAKCDPAIVSSTVKQEIDEYAPIYFNEDIMSCINFEKQ